MIANHYTCPSCNDLNKLMNTVKHHCREHLLTVTVLFLVPLTDIISIYLIKCS